MKIRRLPIRALKASVIPGEPDPIAAEERFLYESVRKALGGGASSPEIWTGLEWFPRVARLFPITLLRHPELRRRLTGAPLAAWYALTMAIPQESIQRYQEVASFLEPTIMGDGETLMLYLAWAQKVSAKLPREFSEYRMAMAHDPIVGVKWAKSMGDDTFPSALLDWAAANVSQSAAAAWVMAVSSAERPDSFRPVIALDPYYATVSAVTLKMKFRCDEFVDINARWLYHLLVADALEDPWTAEGRLMNEDPAWGLEYLIETNRQSDRSEIAKLLPGLRAWRDAKHPAVRVIAMAVDNLIPKD